MAPRKMDVEFLELFQRTVGKDFAGALVALTAEIEALVVQLDTVLDARGVHHLDALG